MRHGHDFRRNLMGGVLFAAALAGSAGPLDAKSPAPSPTPKTGAGLKTPVETPQPVKEEVRSQEVVGSMKKPPSDCGKGSEYLSKALELYQKKQYDVAVELATQVQPDRKCQFAFMQACGLLSGIYVFELKDFEKGVAAAKKGLALDARQTSLWFTTGYAQYQVDSYEEAAESFRKVLQHFPVVPLPEGALSKARYLLGDSLDRNATREGRTPEDQAALMAEAVTVWQEYQDYCAEATCEDLYLFHATERVEQLRRDLQILRLRSGR